MLPIFYACKFVIKYKLLSQSIPLYIIFLHFGKHSNYRRQSYTPPPKKQNWHGFCQPLWTSFSDVEFWGLVGEESLRERIISKLSSVPNGFGQFWGLYRGPANWEKRLGSTFLEEIATDRIRILWEAIRFRKCSPSEVHKRRRKS